MKNAIILEGAGSTTDQFWYQSVKNELEGKGYEVWMPELPDNNSPKLQVNLDFVLSSGKLNSDTVLIGHSAGCPLILALLEKIDFKIPKAIMVAAFWRELPSARPDVLQDNYNWEKIKSNCNEFVIINSVNDPWGCNDVQGREIFDKLGGMLIINNEGHMGSLKFGQTYTKFPLVVGLVEE